MATLLDQKKQLTKILKPILMSAMENGLLPKLQPEQIDHLIDEVAENLVKNVSHIENDIHDKSVQKTLLLCLISAFVNEYGNLPQLNPNGPHPKLKYDFLFDKESRLDDCKNDLKGYLTERLTLINQLLPPQNQLNDKVIAEKVNELANTFTNEMNEKNTSSIAL